MVFVCLRCGGVFFFVVLEGFLSMICGCGFISSKRSRAG